MSWACDRCTLEQSDRRRACAACGNLRPDLLRACFPEAKRQKRNKDTSAVGGIKGGAANPRGVWSSLTLTPGMVPLPRRPQTAANPRRPNCRCSHQGSQASSDKYGREGEGHGGVRRARQLGRAANHHGWLCSARRRTASAVSSTALPLPVRACPGQPSRVGWGRGRRLRASPPRSQPPGPALALKTRWPTVRAHRAASRLSRGLLAPT